ncbi:hypothetical protein Droror1_Dr00009974 [Drosera rotundifolia]
MQQDKIHPSTKPHATTTTAAPPQKPPIKPPPPYNTNNIYQRRQQPPPRRRRRSCRRGCCLCFLYAVIVLLILLLLAATAGTIFYFIYHPKHPSFSLSSLSFPSLNLTAPVPSSQVNLTFVVKNPNAKLVTFVYSDSITLSLIADGVDLGNSSFPGFVSKPKNVTVIEGVIESSEIKGQDPEAVATLKGDVGKKKGFPVVAEVETGVRVKIGKVRTMRFGLRLVCDGIKGFAPTTKEVAAGKNRTAVVVAPGAAVTDGVNCKTKLRIKIWKITW